MKKIKNERIYKNIENESEHTKLHGNWLLLTHIFLNNNEDYI